MCRSQTASSASMFQTIAADFNKYHRNTLNVVLHLITTPLGWMCSLRLLAQVLELPQVQEAGGDVVSAFLAEHSVTLPLVLGLLHSVICFATVPFVYAVLTLAMNVALALGASAINIPYGIYGTAAAVGVAFVGQDISHWITGEPTYQSSYNAVGTFLLHTFYLLPLCFDSYAKLRRGAFYWLVPRNNTIKTHITDTKSLNAMHKWVFENNPSKETTTHWWYHDLKGEVKEAFDAIANAKEVTKAFFEVWDEKAYDLEVVHGMNEVYVASPTQMKSSDKVFLMDHIDGPWVVWPFCAVYRALAAINENQEVSTHLTELRSKVVLTKGDILGFDFNREIHRVEFDPTKQNPEPRVTLKLHYVVYPKSLKPFGKLLAFVTTQYDIIARNLFLYTIKPTTLLQKFSARVGVLLTTYLVERFEAMVGIHNVLRACLFYAAAATVRVQQGGTAFDAEARTYFWYSVSFIHYLTYIATFYYRSEVNYGRLLRDCKFWKALSIGQLFLYFFLGFSPDAVTITLWVLGYGLGAWATYAIGIDRTYFGAELDIHPPKWISAFPYSHIPHPMILGALIGLAGFHWNAAFRAAHPFLIPIHWALYITHATQEHFNVHDKKWRSLERHQRKVE